MKKAKKNSVSDRKTYNKLLDCKVEFYALPIVLVIIAAAFIVYGIFDKEITAVFNKAINLCRECVGIG